RASAAWSHVGPSTQRGGPYTFFTACVAPPRTPALSHAHASSEVAPPERHVVQVDEGEAEQTAVRNRELAERAHVAHRLGRDENRGGGEVRVERNEAAALAEDEGHAPLARGRAGPDRELQLRVAEEIGALFAEATGPRLAVASAGHLAGRDLGHPGATK